LNNAHPHIFWEIYHAILPVVFVTDWWAPSYISEANISFYGKGEWMWQPEFRMEH